MGIVSDPQYDEDYVTLSYLNEKTDEIDENIINKTKNYGTQPVPPYYVNDTYMDGTNIYVCKTERLIGSFNSADWDFASNYTDDTLAESKNKVYINQPTTPYSIGDVWTQGPNGEMRRCIYARTSSESYTESDWENATKYDSTETTVEDGLVTTGTVEVVQGGTVAAGITGNTSGDTAVRFWAGSTLANRASAPFRVLQNGTLYATGVNIEGSIGNSTLDWSTTNVPTQSNLGTWTTKLTSAGIYTGTLTASQVNAVNIDADSIDTGTLSTSRLNSDVITTSNFSAQSINASKINSGTLSASYISGGTLSGSTLYISNSARFYNGSNFFSMNYVSSHPIVSGLNVSIAGGINFRSGASSTSSGTGVASINSTSGGGLTYGSGSGDHYLSGGNTKLQYDLYVYGHDIYTGTSSSTSTGTVRANVFTGPGDVSLKNYNYDNSYFRAESTGNITARGTSYYVRTNTLYVHDGSDYNAGYNGTVTISTKKLTFLRGICVNVI